MHAFIESDVTSSLDSLTVDIVVDGIAHGLLVSEEDAYSSIDIKFTIARFGRKSINVTAENAK